MFTKIATKIIVISIIWRLLFFLFLILWNPHAGLPMPDLSGDAGNYWQLGKNLAYEHRLYLVDETKLNLRRPPGYPFFLASLVILFGEHASLYIAILLQIVLWSWAVFLLYQIINNYFSERVAFAASLLFIFEPNATYYSLQILSDTLFVFLLILAIYIFINKRPSSKTSFAVGLVLGLTTLVRPISEFLPLILPVVILLQGHFSRESLKRASLIVLGAAIIIMPWMTRNLFIAKSFDISSSGTSTYYKYVLPSFISITENNDYETIQKQLANEFKATTQDLNTSSTRFMKEKIITTVFAHPIRYGIFHVIKTLPLFLSDGVREILQKLSIINEKQPNLTSLILRGQFKKIISLFYTTPLLLLAIIGVGFWIIIIVLGIVGFYSGGIHSSRTRFPIILFLILICYSAILIGPASTTRHRMMILPWISALAAIGYEFLRERQTKIKS